MSNEKPPASPDQPRGYVSQQQAVGLALQALGDDTPNDQLVAWVREHYGHDVSKYISQFKNASRKTAAAPGKPVKKAAPKPPAAKPVAKPASPIAGLADDLTALAKLSAKYGADEVRGMLAALDAASGIR